LRRQEYVVYRAYPLQESREEDDMAREWALGSKGSLNNRTMDETLIEVYGCVSLHNMLAGLDAGRDGNVMDETLIEVFGCVSLDNRVVRLDAGRERKAARAGLKAPLSAPEVERGLRVRYH
jgi:hypothetical protein